VLLDTGSAPLWIPNASIAANLTTWHHTYDCSESKTCSAKEENVYNISYGMGSILGTEMIEDIQIGSVKVPQYHMLLASDIKFIPNNYYDGIMGLSLGRWSYLNHFPTLLETLKTSGAISTGMFSMYLGNDPDAIGKMTGEIIFGGYDPKYADSDFQFVHLESGSKTLLWTTNMSALGFGAKNVSDITNFPTIFDSGGSLSIFPKTFIDNIIKEAEALGVKFTLNNMTNNYDCDCNAQDKLPDLHFYFDNATFNLKASSYILSNYGKCYLGLLVLRGEIGLYEPAVLGDMFLKDHYALYTLDNNTVGLAKAKVFSNDIPVEEPGHWKVVLLVLGIVVLVVGGGVCLYQKKKKKDVEDYIQASSEFDQSHTEQFYQ